MNNVRRGKKGGPKKKKPLGGGTPNGSGREVVKCTPTTGTKWTESSMRPSTKQSTETTMTK